MHCIWVQKTCLLDEYKIRSLMITMGLSVEDHCNHEAYLPRSKLFLCIVGITEFREQGIGKSCVRRKTDQRKSVLWFYKNVYVHGYS